MENAGRERAFKFKSVVWSRHILKLRSLHSKTGKFLFSYAPLQLSVSKLSVQVLTEENRANKVYRLSQKKPSFANNFCI